MACVTIKVQGKRGLRWIPRHSEAKKGVVADERLRGAGLCKDPEIPEWGNPNVPASLWFAGGNLAN